MSSFVTLFVSRKFLTIALSVIVSFLFVFIFAQGATIISTNITTGGTLTVTSTASSTFSGNISVSDMLVGGTLEIPFLTATSSTASNFIGGIGVASSSPSQEVGIVGDMHLGSAATTTLTISSSGTDTGGCIQLEGADGTMYRIYATTTGPLIAEAGSCQ